MKLIRVFSVILPVLIFISGCQENNSTDEKLYKAVTSANAGDWDTAAAIADDVSAIYQKAAFPIMLRALAYEKQGDIAKAIDLARKAANAEQKDFTVQYTYGRLCAQNPRRRAEAFTVLENALILKPGDTDTLVLLCTIGMERNEPNTDQYLNLLKHDPQFDRSAQLYYMLGVRQAEKRNLDAAKRFMMDALGKCGGAKDPNFIYHVAHCFDRNRFPSVEVKKFYNLFLRAKGNKDQQYVLNANKRLRQL